MWHPTNIWERSWQVIVAMPRTQGSSHKTLSAYVKLIPSVLSSPSYTVAMKLHCVHLLVMSRAMFNTNLWVVDSRVWVVANRVFDHALRHVAGEFRMMGFKRKPAVEIRKALGVESIDCIKKKME